MSDIADGFWQTYSAVLELWDISLIPPPMLRVFLRKAAAFRSRLSRRSAFTSSLVAEREVSPARRFLPASRNSFDQL